LTPQTAPLQCRERVIKPVARFTYDQTTETSSAACERSRARSKRKQTKQENLSAKAKKMLLMMVLCPQPRVFHRGTHQPRREPKKWLLRFVLCSITDPWSLGRCRHHTQLPLCFASDKNQLTLTLSSQPRSMVGIVINLIKPVLRS
jgi:hypothetical protein